MELVRAAMDDIEAELHRPRYQCAAGQAPGGKAARLMRIPVASEQVERCKHIDSVIGCADGAAPVPWLICANYFMARLNRKHEAALLEALQQDGVDMLSEPQFARYNGPFTPWFMRRNEIIIPVTYPIVDDTRTTARLVSSR